MRTVQDTYQNTSSDLDGNRTGFSEDAVFLVVLSYNIKTQNDTRSKIESETNREMFDHVTFNWIR